MQTLRWKKTRSLLLALLLMAAVVLTGCGSKEPEQTEPTEIIWETAPAETLGIAVDNAYMTFYYPQEWDGRVEEVREETDGNVMVTFRTDISGKEVVLFSIVMGPEEAEGYLLGHLTEGGKQIFVYSVMNEMPAEDWSEADYAKICALQERVNDIIIQFFEDPRFTPNT